MFYTYINLLAQCTISCRLSFDTRVFGKGEHNLHQFTDEEIIEIDKKITSRNPETAVVSYHNVRMYKDTARYKIYKETKKFPPATKARGQQSLRIISMEDAEFPATKAELVRKQGWKIIDLTYTDIHSFGSEIWQNFSRLEFFFWHERIVSE